MKNLIELIPEIYVPITLPFSKKEINVRAYKHADSKCLLRAHSESQTRKKGRGKLLLGTMEQLISKCIKEDIDIKMMNIVDFAFLMNYINYISKESKTELMFSCGNCGKKHQIVFDINDCVVTNHDNVKTNVAIKLGEKDVIFHMKEYTFRILLENGDMFADDQKSGEEITKFMASFIDGIEIDSEIHDDITFEEKCMFLDQLPVSLFEPINKYFDSIPKLLWCEKFECDCGFENEAEISEIMDFFSI